jgi:two-component system NtrC family response regulator
MDHTTPADAGCKARAHTILVVDDEADFVATYRRSLARPGYRVIGAGTVQEAIARLRSELPNLVVSDLRLPDGDGLEIVRAARALPTPPPVVVVTGFGSEKSRRDAAAAGATAYVTRPFSLPTLIKLTDDLLRGPCGMPTC